MNDPFASLDPIQKPKTAAERVLTPSYNPPGAPVAVAPFGGGAPMHMGMGAMHMNQGMGTNMGGGGMGMGMGMPSMGNGGGMNMGMPGMGSMNPCMPGMNTGMGGMGMNPAAPNPFQQPPQQQQTVMYDNIKNLLQQKPKAPAAFEDTASMDFLANLGGGGGTNAFGSAKTNSGSSFSVANPQVRAAEPTSMPIAAAVDPFGGGFGGSLTAPAATPGDIGLSIFETGISTGKSNPSNPVSPSGSSGGAKSSALAERLANGRRKTQEAQRSQLQLNANSFAHAGGAAGPKISLKEMVGEAPTKSAEPGIVSLDDFASGGAVPSGSSSFGGGDFFGGGSDAFNGGTSSRGGGTNSRGGSFGTAAATNSGGAVRQSSFGDDEPKPVDENDSTFW